ncbi:MAG: Cof-type HAD-IIB family hydrolase [Bacteroidales bacterium]|nr:Cof-type HAD-IIB family hydrolase [Bacteroidales bacterium]
MIKAAFFDIDGTLVGFHDAEIRDEVLEALDALRRKGIRLYISSGRPQGLIRNLKDYPFDGYITMNGSLVTLDGEVIYSAPLPREAAVRIAEISEREGFAAVAFLADGMGINLQNDITARCNKMIHVPAFPTVPLVDMVRNNEVYQYTVYITPEQLERHYLPHVPDTAWPRWHPDFVDAVPAQASKASAIACILEKIGLKREEIIAFGDGGNDISMLRFAGIGVAMGNAEDDVKASADYVTAGVDDDGIRKALSHFGLL